MKSIKNKDVLLPHWFVMKLKINKNIYHLPGRDSSADDRTLTLICFKVIDFPPGM